MSVKYSNATKKGTGIEESNILAIGHMFGRGRNNSWIEWEDTFVSWWWSMQSLGLEHLSANSFLAHTSMFDAVCDCLVVMAHEFFFGQISK